MYVVASLRDSHGGESHAITVSDNLIFDSNEKYTLDLCKDNLDRCVSSNIENDEVRSIPYCLCLHPRNNILKMENRVFLSLIWFFLKTGLFNLANETKAFFKTLAVRRLAESDFRMFPSKSINLLLKKQTIRTEFFRQVKKTIPATRIGNMQNVLSTVSEKFRDVMTSNNNLHFVLASDNHEKKNPLIIGILYNVLIINHHGIITQINNEYQNHTHDMFMIIKLCATT